MDAFCKFFILSGLLFTITVNAQQLELKETANTTATNSGLAQELAELKALYSNGNKEEQMLSINSRIRFSGITDIALFDIAEKNMLDTPPDSTKREDIQYVSWMAQMLAFSGQEKYKDSLTKLLATTNTPTIKRHVTSSLEVLPKYQRWNMIIAQNLESVPVSGLGKARLINMLNSDDPELVRGGASIANHFYVTDEEVTDLVEKRLLILYPKSSSVSSDQYAEASSWLCKVLGNTRKQKYIPTLTQILNSTKVPALHRWAKKSLDASSSEPNAAANARRDE
jgi:hypothetical protein